MAVWRQWPGDEETGERATKRARYENGGGEKSRWKGENKAQKAGGKGEKKKEKKQQNEEPQKKKKYGEVPREKATAPRKKKGRKEGNMAM